jgi:hypothetical protein
MPHSLVATTHRAIRDHALSRDNHVRRRPEPRASFEHVAKTLPLLAQYDTHGKPNGIYYEQLSALLLAQNQQQQAQLQREHARSDRLERRVARLERGR